jgi:transposase
VTERPPCGTPKGYKRHLRAKQEPCRPCRDAVAAYVTERRAANPDHRVRAARAAAARRVAMRRLMALHMGEYASLLRAARREAGL